LADVHQVELLANGEIVETDAEKTRPLHASVWFKRGWTLQELLAPRNVICFQDDWTPIGTQQSLGNQLEEASKVPAEYLNSGLLLRFVSVAMKMSWASGRKTSRKENEAYCLMGLFGMPLYVAKGPKPSSEYSSKSSSQLATNLYLPGPTQLVEAYCNLYLLMIPAALPTPATLFSVEL
jgi:hypothetical protein